MSDAVSRRQFFRLAAAAGAGAAIGMPTAGPAVAAEPITRPIPQGGGERLPVVGLGTASAYDEADEAIRQKAREVVAALVAGGGRVIDTASVYGDAEVVLGGVLGEGGLRDKVFLATKLEEPDPAELKRSLTRLATPKLDLLQLHNVADGRQDLGRFREWKAQGACRYIGITTTSHSQFAVVERMLTRDKPDFVQIDYSIDDREAEKRVLPLAAEVGAAVLTALPFGRNRVFRATRGKPLPDWAAAFDATNWAEFFLKYLIGHPAVTAVIPGTANPAHMTEDLGAGRGRLPDAAERRRMAELIDSL